MEYIPNKNYMQGLGVLTLVIAFAEIGLTAATATGYYGPIFLVITGLLASQSSRRAIILAGSIFAVIAIILMITVAVANSQLYNALHGLEACATQATNSSVTTAVDRSYGNLESVYGVGFYGSSNYYDEAGHCEITEYDSHTNCYCTDHSGSCSSYIFQYSCRTLLQSKYQNTVEASYIIAVLSIIIVAFYMVLTCVIICCPPETFYRPAIEVQGDLAVPTTAVVQPTVVTHDAGIATVTLSINSHNDNFTENDGMIKIITAEPVQSSEDTHHYLMATAETPNTS